MFKALLYPVYKRIFLIIGFVWLLTIFKISVSILIGMKAPIVIGLSITLVLIAIAFTLWFPKWYQGFLFRQQSSIKANPLINYFRQGNYAPIQDELFARDLAVEGKLPDGLNGMYVRNGPNPAFMPIAYTYPIDGDGMLHAVTIDKGKVSYKNRYVETHGLLAEKRAGHALYGGIDRIIPVDPKLIGTDPNTSDVGPIKNTASIHIVRLGNYNLALYEAAKPYAISDQLETIGPWHPKGYDKPFHMNAHTKRCPDTGELYAFKYDVSPPYLSFYVFDKKGVLKEEHPIEKPHMTMMHDFVLTENYLVFFDCPAVFDPKTYWGDGRLLDWRPDLNTIIIIVNRKTKAETRIEMDPFFVYHFANGYEAGDEIIVDYIRHETLTLGDALHTDLSTLHRMNINLKTEQAASHLLFDRRIEFPRINEAYVSKPYRYIYAPIKTMGHIQSFHAIVKFDLETRKAYTHDFGDHCEVDEACFIPNPTYKRPKEESGWLGLFVYDRYQESSEFVVLDARKIQEKPIARIKLPQRVPHGLHGSWMPK